MNNHKIKLLKSLKNVERLSKSNKLVRFLNNPLKYLEAISFKYLSFKKNKQPKVVQTNTFFNKKMHLYLPSSTDIYLTGGKSHFSEIKLAKFLIKNLNDGDIFFDVGAHYGYFTLLGAHLVGKLGKVFAFEASPATFKILHKNKNNFENIETYNQAVSDKSGELTFYEFPNLFSEFNSIYINQHQNSEWFIGNKPKKVKVAAIVLDDFLSTNKHHTKIIKIDVEGAEYEVIKGLQNYLTQNQPIIVLEFLSKKLGNNAHKKAKQLITTLGYQAHYLNKDGDPKILKDTSVYFENKKIDSDNFIFIKSSKFK